MNRNLSIVCLISLTLLMTIGISHGQSDQVTSLLQQLQSPDVTLRSDAFYKLQAIGISSDDRITVAIINLLKNEEANLQVAVVRDTLGESFSTYYGDLIQAVASLNDIRALNALVGAIDTGHMAMDAVVNFGAPAVDPIILELSSSDAGLKDAAEETIEIMLQPNNFPKFRDPISKNKIRAALNQLTGDSSVYIRDGAAAALTQLARLDIPGDVNGDGVVDCADIAIIKASFGKKTGQVGFDVRADVNTDGIVDIRDLAFVSQKLPAGTQCPVLTGPLISVSVNPETLWPPNGKTVPVAVTGAIKDNGWGIDFTTVGYAVTDEYGVFQPRGSVALGTNGTYSFTVLLEASRLGNDTDGRKYTLTISAKDNAGNLGSASAVITVPHDRRP